MEDTSNIFSMTANLPYGRLMAHMSFSSMWLNGFFFPERQRDSETTAEGSHEKF